MRISAGAGFIVAVCGEIMTMSGLLAHSAIETICINENGKVDGLL